MDTSPTPSWRSRAAGCSSRARSGYALDVKNLHVCADHVAEVRAAVLYEKPQSAVRCEYVWRRTDRWIDFPWSTLPPVVTRPGQVRDA